MASERSSPWIARSPRGWRQSPEHGRLVDEACGATAKQGRSPTGCARHLDGVEWPSEDIGKQLSPRGVRAAAAGEAHCRRRRGATEFVRGCPNSERHAFQRAPQQGRPIVGEREPDPCPTHVRIEPGCPFTRQICGRNSGSVATPGEAAAAYSSSHVAASSVRTQSNARPALFVAAMTYQPCRAAVRNKVVPAPPRSARSTAMTICTSGAQRQLKTAVLVQPTAEHGRCGVARTHGDLDAGGQPELFRRRRRQPASWVAGP